MLWADKRALETNLKVQLLQIRERELEFYVRNTLTICVVATIILGFSYTRMTEAVPSDYAGVGPYAVRVLYMVSCMSSLGFMFVSLISTTLLSMLAPGLALRGPDGAMHPAVDGMIDEYRSAFYAFLGGLLCFHAMAALAGWVHFHHLAKKDDDGVHAWEYYWLSSLLSFLVAVSLFNLVRAIRKIFVTFALPEGSLVTGKFEDPNAARAAGIVDAGEVGTLSELIRREQLLEAAQDEVVE